MDSFHYNVETDHESNPIERDIRLQSMGKSFRTIELCIALFFLLWVVLHLPFAVRIFGDLLRRLFLLLLTPLIISLLFGVCVATLMVKSYRVSAQNIADNNAAGTNFYENIVSVGELQATTSFHHQHEVEEVVYEDKEIVMSNDCDQAKTKTPIAATCVIPAGDVDSDMGNELEAVVEKSIVEDDGVVLEKKCSSPRDLLNDAEFKKTIDGFIKKQREFLKLENRCDYYGEAHVYCY